MCAANGYFTSLGKNSPNLIKRSLRMQRNKKDLVNEWTQWFRRKLWEKEKCLLEGPKPAPLVSQPRSRGPAILQGPPPCLHKSDSCREGHGMHVALHVSMCLFNGAAPGAKKERDFPEMVLSGLHQKIARDSKRISIGRISCVSTHDCKNPNGLNMPKPTPI